MNHRYVHQGYNDTCIICGNLRGSNKIQVHNDCRPSSLSSFSLQNTFADLSQVLREEESFNPLKFADKMKDVKNTKRADMISKMMILKTRISRNGGNWVRSNMFHLFCIKQRSILTLDPNNVM